MRLARGASMRTHLLTTTAVMALISASTVSTRAQTNWTGAISSNWFNASNWSGGLPTGINATIDTVTPKPTVVAAPGATQSVPRCDARSLRRWPLRDWPHRLSAAWLSARLRLRNQAIGARLCARARDRAVPDRARLCLGAQGAASAAAAGL